MMETSLQNVTVSKISNLDYEVWDEGHKPKANRTSHRGNEGRPSSIILRPSGQESPVFCFKFFVSLDLHIFRLPATRKTRPELDGSFAKKGCITCTTR